jgi:hypothetical protein
VSDPGDRVELRFIHDGPGSYLFGDDVRYRRLFDHWTVGAVTTGRQLRPYRLDFKKLAATADVADLVHRSGWQYAAFVAKIMTSSKSAMDAYEVLLHLPFEERSKAPEVKPEAHEGFPTNMFQGFPEEQSEAWDEIRRVVGRHISFESKLFVVKSTRTLHERTPKIDGLPDHEREYRVAGIDSKGRRVLQAVLGDREESYYGFFGDFPKDGRRDPATLREATWQGLSAMHQMLHTRTVNAIASGALDRAIA